MTTLIHADIFFFVTTIVVIVVALLLVVALVYLIQALRTVRDIGREIKEETALIREDLEKLRKDVGHEGFWIERFMNLIRTISRKVRSKTKEK